MTTRALRRGTAAAEGAGLNTAPCLTCTGIGCKIVDVASRVRTACYPQASGPAYKANHAKNLLYGDNGLGAGAYSHPLPSDKRFFRYMDGRCKVITPHTHPNR